MKKDEDEEEAKIQVRNVFLARFFGDRRETIQRGL